MKAWDPTWSALPHVEPVQREGLLPARELTPGEKLRNRQQYQRMHLDHVLAKQEGESDG